jgi:DNA-directed RNA polymerase subunit RPC12/RpoP
VTERIYVCPRCGATYRSPLAVEAVSCRNCSTRSRKEVWMKPEAEAK